MRRTRTIVVGDNVGRKVAQLFITVRSGEFRAVSFAWLKKLDRQSHCFVLHHRFDGLWHRIGEAEPATEPV